MEYYHYPKEASNLFREVLEKIENNKKFTDIFFYLRCKYEDAPEFSSDTFKVLKRLAKLMGYNKYTLYFVFILTYTQQLKNKYDQLKLDEKLYYDTMADLSYKLKECMTCKGVPGTFVPSWFCRFFKLGRITLGRFQFEIESYKQKKPFKFSCGKEIKKGERFINMHIPSSGVQLSDEVRFDAYKRAYEMFCPLFKGEDVIFGCHSWLLYPKNKEILPDTMNVVKFMNDFEIVSTMPYPYFIDGWRVYGKDFSLNPKKLPRNTTMQRAFADYLSKGKLVGEGVGMFLFDGEKIIR